MGMVRAPPGTPTGTLLSDVPPALPQKMIPRHHQFTETDLPVSTLETDISVCHLSMPNDKDVGKTQDS